MKTNFLTLLSLPTIWHAQYRSLTIKRGPDPKLCDVNATL